MTFTKEHALNLPLDQGCGRDHCPPDRFLNDICLLKLDSPLELNDKVSIVLMPLCLMEIPDLYVNKQNRGLNSGSFKNVYIGFEELASQIETC